jgi:hypothetical protein
VAVTIEDMCSKPYGDSEVGNLCCDYGNFKYVYGRNVILQGPEGDEKP